MSAKPKREFAFSEEDEHLGRSEALFRRLLFAVSHVRGLEPLAAGREFAVFGTARGEALAVVHVGHGDRPLEDIAARLTAKHARLVAVGGPEGAIDALQGLTSAASRVSLHHVADSGAVWSGGASRKPSTELQAGLDAMHRGAGGPPPTDAEIRDLTTTLAERGRTRSRDLDEVRQKLRTAGRPATLVVTATLVVCFGLQHLFGGPDALSVAVRMGAILGSESLSHEPWRLLAYSFLHGGLFHIGFAVAIVYGLGSTLERLMGSAAFVGIYAASALGGGIAAALFGGAGVTLGSSGALWGVMTGAWVLSREPGDVLPEAMAGPLRRSLGQTLALNLLISFAPNISMAGHLGGGLAGALLMTAFLRARASGRRPGAAVLAAGGLALTASLGAALTTGTPWALLDDSVEVVQTSGGAVVAVPRYMGPDAAFVAGEPIDGLPLPGATEHTIGRLLRDGLVIDVRNLPRSPADGTDAQLADVLVQGPDEGRVDGWQASGPAERLDLPDGSAYVRTRTAANGAVLWRLVTLRPTRIGIVEVVKVADPPAAAARVEERTLEALR